MRASAHQVKALDLLAAVMRAKPGALEQLRLEREGSTLHAQQTVTKILRRQHAGGDDVLPETRQNRLFEPPLDRRTIWLRRNRPVGAAGQVGHRRQYVEGVAARRRERAVRHARTVQIEAEIIRQALSGEDIGEQRLVARPEHHGVVEDAVVAAVGTEIPDEET